MRERDLMFPDWQLQYFAALSEGPPETLRERVEDAERAILIWLEQLASGPEREMEQFAILVLNSPERRHLRRKIVELATEFSSASRRGADSSRCLGIPATRNRAVPRFTDLISGCGGTTT
jgi:hypothetical protein